MNEQKSLIPKSDRPTFDQLVTITAPRWVFDALVVGGQMENDRRKKNDPIDAERFTDAWKIIHRFIEFESPAGEDAIAASLTAKWRRCWPSR